jgi:MFS transporter, DHA1 family, tetracycline resistance protein
VSERGVFRSLGVLWLIVFVSMMGFGITTVPFPLVAEQVGASHFWKTFGGPGVFSLFQLIATPLWGRCSDAVGRKPILIVSMLGSVIAYAWLAQADTLTGLVAARALGGAMSGNLSAAFAYTADVTAPHERARGLGIVTSAFGLGFAVGPFIGGVLGSNPDGSATLVEPALAAALLSAAAVAGGIAWLRESLPANERKPLRRVPGSITVEGATPGPRALFASRAGRAAVVLLSAIALLVTTAAAAMQSVYPFWARDLFGHGTTMIGVQFAWLAGFAVVGQLALVAPAVKFLGEKGTVFAAIGGAVASLLVLAVTDRSVELWCALTLLGVSLGLFTPALTSLVSFEATPGGRGAIMGIYQASNSAGRIVGPALAGPLYFTLGHAAPYALCAALCLLGAVLLASLGRSTSAVQG